MNQPGIEIISFGVNHGLFKDTLIKAIHGLNYLECKDTSLIYKNLESKDGQNLIVLGSFGNNLKEETKFLKMAENITRLGTIVLLSDNIKDLHQQIKARKTNRNIVFLKNSKDQIELTCQVQLLVNSICNLMDNQFEKQVKEKYVLKKVEFEKDKKKININTIKTIKKLPKSRFILLSKDEELVEEILEKFEMENIGCDVVDSSEVALSQMRKAIKKKERYSAVLTDNNFYGMGLEIWLQVLKADILLRKVPVIVIGDDSGENNPAVSGLKKIIDKNFEVSELLQYLDSSSETEEEKDDTDKEQLKRQDVLKGKNIDLQVLVVDDQAMMRKTLTGMLGKMGFQNIDTTDDGQKAIDKAKKKLYDYVFMDVHMENMDGPEATRKIREFDEEVTIVALTGEDDEVVDRECLDAGMNELIKKPISKSDLCRLLSLRINEQKSGTLVGESHEMDVSLVDNEANDRIVFNKNEAIETFGGNIKLLNEIINKFIENTPMKIAEISNALSEKQFGRISLLAHGFKGGTEYVGAEKLKDISVELEQAGCSEDESKIGHLINMLKNEYKEFKEEISKTIWE